MKLYDHMRLRDQTIENEVLSGVLERLEQHKIPVKDRPDLIDDLTQTVERAFETGAARWEEEHLERVPGGKDMLRETKES
jgi:hypothetical protein